MRNPGASALTATSIRPFSMRALVNTRFGGPEVLEVQTLPDPTPKAGEVLVRVKRAGLNFSDIAARVGLYPDAPRFPTVMGYEIAGVVERLGEGVTSLAVGQRVVAMTRFGGHATLVCIPASQLRTIPEALSFDQAAALPVNYLTAWHLLFHIAPIKPGMKVLVHMAAGGVGLAVIQLSRSVPDIELFGTASKVKHDLLRQQGLHHPIDPRETDYVAEVRRLTDGRGVHRVLDPLGGPDWTRGYSVLRTTGHLLCYGWSNMVSGERRSLWRIITQFLQLRRYSPMDLMDKNRSVSGVNLGHLWDETELMASHLQALLDLAQQGLVAPHVDRTFALDDARAAHEYIQQRKNIGKVLLSLD